MQRRMNGRSAPPASAALTQELHEVVESDPCPFSPRIRTMRAILAKLRPAPMREPLPPRKVCAAARRPGQGTQGRPLARKRSRSKILVAEAA